MRAYLLVLLIPSIALLFLPYTYGVSPWATVLGVLAEGWVDFPRALLGGPFFLSIPIVLAQTSVLLKRPFSKGERATCRLLAYAALAAGLAVLALVFGSEEFSKGGYILLLSFIWGIPCAAAVWMMILSARKLSPEAATTVMLRAAWLPNAVLCAIAFWDVWQIGAYLAAFTIVLYTVEITLSMRGKRQTLSTPLVIPS